MCWMGEGEKVSLKSLRFIGVDFVYDSVEEMLSVLCLLNFIFLDKCWSNLSNFDQSCSLNCYWILLKTT